MGIGAKVTSQKEQISNSVFLNQKLAQKLTGRDMTNRQKSDSFMKQYTGNKKASVPVKRKDEEDSEEESRSKVLGKSKLINSQILRSNKKRK